MAERPVSGLMPGTTHIWMKHADYEPQEVAIIDALDQMTGTTFLHKWGSDAQFDHLMIVGLGKDVPRTGRRVYQDIKPLDVWASDLVEDGRTPWMLFAFEDRDSAMRFKLSHEGAI